MHPKYRFRFFSWCPFKPTNQPTNQSDKCTLQTPHTHTPIHTHAYAHAHAHTTHNPHAHTHRHTQNTQHTTQALVFTIVQTTRQDLRLFEQLLAVRPEILLDPQKRATYDLKGIEGVRKMEAAQTDVMPHLG